MAQQELTAITAALQQIAKDKGLASLVTVEYVETLLTSLLPSERAAMEKMYDEGVKYGTENTAREGYCDTITSDQCFDTYFTQTVK